MFDAGAIEASLTVRTDQFDRDMSAAEARVKRLEDEPHKIKMAAEFDQSSMSKARKAFTDLDNAISKDAMSRLRSNPQGSVLGALNALFSPHPVTGAPSPQQAAQQGLLGKIIQAPGGGGTTGPVGGNNRGNVVQDVLGSAGGGTQSNASRVSTVGLPQNTTTTDKVNVVGAPGNNNITTTDRVNAVGLPKSGATINTTDTVSQRVIPARDPVTGRFAGANTTSTNTVRERLDPAAAATAEAAAKASGDRAGKGWASSFASHLTALFGNLGGGGPGNGKSGGTGGGGAGGLAGGILGGIGPGILGVSAKAGAVVGLGGSVLGALPALVGGLSPLLAAAPGLAGLGAIAAGTIKQVSPVLQASSAAQTALSAAATPAALQAAQQQVAAVNKQVAALSPALQSVYKSIQSIGNTWQALSGSFAPVMAKALQQVAGQFNSLLPDLRQFFTASATLMQPLIGGLGDIARQLLPEFSAAISAAAPLIRPLLDGLGSLVSGIFPGLITLVKAASPAVTVLSAVFATLGRDLGSMLADFAPVLVQSGVLLKALFDVIGGLLPVVAKLAGIFATALAPIFVQFAKIVQSLEPVLILVGNVLSSLAGAVVGDLVSAFGALSTVITSAMPGLTVLASGLGQVFTVLENTGVFAIFGNALENLAAPLGTLVSTLARGLSPVLQTVVKFVGQVSAILATQLSNAILALLPPLTQLATVTLGALAAVLPVILPLLVAVTQVLTTALVGVITGLATALDAVISAMPPGVLGGIAVGIAAVVGAMKLWGLATTAVSSGMAKIAASSFGSAIANAASVISDFAAAAEGASAAETAMVGASLALEAVSPFAWAAVGVGLLGALTVALVAVSAQSQTIVGEFQAQQQQLGYNIAGYQKLAGTIDTASAGYAKFAKSSTDAVRGGAAGAQTLSTQLSAQSQAVLQAAASMQSRLTTLSQGLGVSKTTIEQWASAAGISAVKFSGAGENVGLLTQQIVGFVNKNAAAITATSSLGTNVAIFGNDVFSATTQLDAFNQIWNTLVGNLLTKQMAVTSSNTAFDNLTQTIKSSGAGSDAAKQSFQQYIAQIGSSASTLEKQGASVATVNSYLQGQIDHIKTLGPLNASEKADLQGLTSFQDALANSTNGLNAQQKTLIGQFEQHLIPDLVSMHANTPLANTDISHLANSIIQTGNNSASTAGDRAKLIADLEQAGVKASVATGFVDGLQGKIDALKGKVVQVGVTATAQGTLNAIAHLPGQSPTTSSLFFSLGNGAASGMLVTGGTPGKDSVLAMLMPGEVVVPTSMVNAGAVDHLKGSIPGFAAGGMVNLDQPGQWAAGQEGSWGQKTANAWAQAVKGAFEASAAKAATAAAQFVATQGASGGFIQSLMKNMAAARGWTGAEWNALAYVETREAGFNMTATNPSSGAYGLAQFINGPSEYAQYGGNSTTAIGQITGMLNYISQRYGDPIAAANHEAAFNWYGNGGMISEPVIGRGLNSGRGYVLGERGSEMVTPVGGMQGASISDLAARLDQLHADMREMVTATRQVPAGVGAHVGGAISGAAHDASFRSRYPRSN